VCPFLLKYLQVSEYVYVYLRVFVTYESSGCKLLYALLGGVNKFVTFFVKKDIDIIELCRVNFFPDEIFKSLRGL
jgi:hypothetical protein